MSDPANLAVWTYAAAALGFAGFAGALWPSARSARQGRLLIAVLLLSACWCAAAALYAVSTAPAWLLFANGADLARLGAWFLFLVSLFAGARDPAGAAAQAPLLPRSPRTVVVAALLAGGLMLQILPQDPGQLETLSRLAYADLLLLAIIGLALVEQVFRNVSTHARWGVKPLCLGLGGAFCLDLYIYADAFLFNRLQADLWSVRGLANLSVVPLIAASTVRNRNWRLPIVVSRQVVFHSTTLLASGLYLLTIAAAGYYVRYFGGNWGGALQALLLFVGLMTLCLLFFSGSLRSKWRVFLAKNFFRYRYDYREEWLRFTHALTVADPQLGVVERAIKALADLVESPGGALWLADPSGSYRQSGRWNMAESSEVEPRDGALASFLARKEWVIDLSQARQLPGSGPATLPDWLADLAEARLVVPLCARGELSGFLVLASPRAKVDLNWEVRDLLKTAARQAASYLAHIRAVEALLEAQKFDSFNRMSAFVVHDLKNLVAQLSLVLKNAERHKNKPEFQADMLMTIDNVVERMKQLLMQLRAGTTPVEKPRPVSLAPIIGRIERAKAGHKPELIIDLGCNVEVLGHADRLERVIGHLVENAIEATPQDGSVWLKLKRHNDRAILEVGDTGAGMSQQFIRERLFKPFCSTKESGMGIGAYESSQYIGELGGMIVVDSKENVGTVVRIELPARSLDAAVTA